MTTMGNGWHTRYATYLSKGVESIVAKRIFQQIVCTVAFLRPFYCVPLLSKFCMLHEISKSDNKKLSSHDLLKIPSPGIICFNLKRLKNVLSLVCLTLHYMVYIYMLLHNKFKVKSIQVQT